MSVWSPLKGSTVYVAEPTGHDDHGDPTYGSPQEIGVHFEDVATIERSEAGVVRNDVDRIVTDEYEFSDGTLIWLPGRDETDVSEGEVPQEVGQHSVAHLTLYYADL